MESIYHSTANFKGIHGRRTDGIVQTFTILYEYNTRNFSHYSRTDVTKYYIIVSHQNVNALYFIVLID